LSKEGSETWSPFLNSILQNIDFVYKIDCFGWERVSNKVKETPEPLLLLRSSENLISFYKDLYVEDVPVGTILNIIHKVKCHTVLDYYLYEYEFC